MALGVVRSSRGEPGATREPGARQRFAGWPHPRWGRLPERSSTGGVGPSGPVSTASSTSRWWSVAIPGVIDAPASDEVSEMWKSRRALDALTRLRCGINRKSSVGVRARVVARGDTRFKSDARAVPARTPAVAMAVELRPGARHNRLRALRRARPTLGP